MTSGSETNDRIARSTLTDSVIDRLRTEIRDGSIQAGSRLRQSDVAQRFEVSTTPVREAFQALEREGLLLSFPHRGVVVFEPTVDDLTETYEIRIPLEAMAIEKAVPNMTAEDLDGLASILSEMRKAEGNRPVYEILNRDFHQHLYAPSRRPKLVKLISDMRDASAAYVRFYFANMPAQSGVNNDHAEIFDACRARAPRRAAKAVERHLERTVEYVTAALLEVEKRA